tara:strand:+ start:3823 stop:4746 length:924 start_codon:yes stop_codon:yes gene_type:complete
MEKVFKVYKAKNNSDEYIVLLAGASQGGFIFTESIPLLQEEYNVITFDNPGLNANPGRPFFTCKDLAKQYVDELKKLNIENYHVVGHCMGGFIAQEMARLVNIKTLTLIASSYGSYRLVKQMDYLFNELKVHKIERFMFTDEFIENNQDKISFYKNICLENKISKEDLFYNFYAGSIFNSLNWINSIESKTLIVHGVKDIMVPYEISKQMAALMPNAELLTINDSAHTPYADNPKLMYKIMDFIKGKQVGEKLEHLKVSTELLEEAKQFEDEKYTKEFINYVQEQYKVLDNNSINKEITKFLGAVND